MRAGQAASRTSEARRTSVAGRHVALRRVHQPALLSSRGRGGVVRKAGLEPARLAALAPKARASTNSATFARRRHCSGGSTHGPRPVSHQPLPRQPGLIGRGGARVSMPLSANVPRRRPAAAASSFISHSRASTPCVMACGRPQEKRLVLTQTKRYVRPSPVVTASRAPSWLAGLCGEIKEEASAPRRMPGDIRCEGLPAATGPLRSQPS